jgi:hypothetical protein
MILPMILRGIDLIGAFWKSSLNTLIISRFGLIAKYR